MQCNWILGDRGQVVAPTSKGKEGVATVMTAESKQLMGADVWLWLIGHGVPRSEIDRKPKTHTWSI